MSQSDRCLVPGYTRPFLADTRLRAEARELCEELEDYGTRLVCGAVDPHDPDVLEFTPVTATSENIAVVVRTVTYNQDGQLFVNDPPVSEDNLYNMLYTRYVGAHSKDSVGRLRTMREEDMFSTGIEPLNKSSTFTACSVASNDGDATFCHFTTGNSVGTGAKAPVHALLSAACMRWYTERIKDPTTGTQKYFVAMCKSQPQNRVVSHAFPSPYSQEALHLSLPMSQYDPEYFVAVVARVEGSNEAALAFEEKFNSCGLRGPERVIDTHHAFFTRRASKFAKLYLETVPKARQNARRTLSMSRRQNK